MLGALCYGVGTFLTLHSGMSSFEGACHTIDGLIDRYVDIETISPMFMDDRYIKVKLRSKSERTLFYRFEDIVFGLCREYSTLHGEKRPYSREFLRECVTDRKEREIALVNAMFTRVISYAYGDISWIASEGDIALQAWIQDNINQEERLVIQQTTLLLDDLAKGGRLG